MNKLKIVYFGSPDFSAKFLEKLISDPPIKNLVEVKLVATQPDRPSGRKRILTPTPVKIVAENFHLPVFNKNLINEKLKLKEVDLALVYSFAQIIPEELLALPKYGFWCIHPSLLPKYRGTSPMATALMNGDKTTGVTIIKMDEKIDHGPIIARERYLILPADRRPDLENKLTDLAFRMFQKLISTDLNRLEPTPQDEQKATYTKKLTKQDGYVPFELIEMLLNPKHEALNPKQISNFKNQNQKLFENLGIGNWDLFRISDLEIRNSSKIIYDYFRGLYPWPGLWTVLPDGKRLKITEMAFINHQPDITGVLLEGKKEVDFPTFNKAYGYFRS